MQRTRTLLLLCLLPLISWADFNARVTRIIDGDTIVVVDSNLKEWTIRLASIDCPEKDQPFASQAKKFTSNACYRKIVRIAPTDKDVFGRTVAFVYYGNICVNESVLLNGFGWHYLKYSNSPKLDSLQKIAQQNKAGLWKMPGALPPWDWRKKK